ncbi:hypothetical protein B0G71_1119 [Paraburkholderia sp. BL27I4N3]|nr:hypothetical protein B0G71_1119 [Paraburkholderia sp. BL27I4N3]
MKQHLPLSAAGKIKRSIHSEWAYSKIRARAYRPARGFWSWRAPTPSASAAATSLRPLLAYTRGGEPNQPYPDQFGCLNQGTWRTLRKASKVTARVCSPRPYSSPNTSSSLASMPVHTSDAVNAVVAVTQACDCGYRVRERCDHVRRAHDRKEGRGNQPRLGRRTYSSSSAFSNQVRDEVWRRRPRTRTRSDWGWAPLDPDR